MTNPGPARGPLPLSDSWGSRGKVRARVADHEHSRWGRKGRWGSEVGKGEREKRGRKENGGEKEEDRETDR